MALINNKAKQFVQHNWGKPKGQRKGLRVRHLDIEHQHVSIKKKRKKEKKKYVYKGRCCPFCLEELPLDEKRMASEKKKYGGNLYRLIEMRYRVTTCPNCKAYEVEECPACKRPTWHRKGWYKHQILGCGFDGKKLVS